MSTFADRILRGTDPDDIVAAVKELAAESMAEIESSLPRAMSGDRRHVRVYVHAFRALNDSMLDAIEKQGKLAEAASGRTAIAQQAEVLRSLQAAGASSWQRALLDEAALHAPFSEWVRIMGSGPGASLWAVKSLRDLMPSLPPVPTPEALIRSDLDLDDRQVARLFRVVIDELQEGHDPLGRLRIAMGLNETELASLFGVSRQAISRWHDRDVPAVHREKLATVGEIADLLTTQLKPERIPGVVRRPSPAYGGHSILDAIAADDQEHVLSELREAFDWSVAA